MKQFLFNMKKCYDLTPDIKTVPISREARDAAKNTGGRVIEIDYQYITEAL